MNELSLTDHSTKSNSGNLIIANFARRISSGRHGQRRIEMCLGMNLLLKHRSIYTMEQEDVRQSLCELAQALAAQFTTAMPDVSIWFVGNSVSRCPCQLVLSLPGAKRDIRNPLSGYF